MQIVATIALGMILGHFLDRWLDTERPWWTLAGATLGIVVALYQLFRDFS